jgi:hypothetical protein
MNILQRMTFLAGSILTGTVVSAQPLNETPTVSLPEFSRQRIQHQRIIGYSLGGYALANIAGSGIAAGQTTGETKQFHRMNVYWNLVNLGIAGFGLLGARKQNPDTESLKDAVQRHNQMKKVLAINAGLDVVYMAGGAYLANRDNNPETADRNRGFGKAIIVQGGFLMAFDVVNYLIFKNRDSQRNALIQATPNGIGLMIGLNAEGQR